MINNHQGKSPPKDFVAQVKLALEHLYDFPYLQRHPLAQEDEFNPEYTTETAARRLRRDLIAAIEALNPGSDVPSHTPQARLYNLLVLHYVEGMTVQEAANESGISRRQAHRNLRLGEESMAEIVWARRAASAPKSPTAELLPSEQPLPTADRPRAVHLSSVQMEMSRLVTHTQPVEVYPLLQEALDAVKQQATQRQVTFETTPLAQPVIVSTDSAMARQVLINALSHAVRQAAPGPLSLALLANDKQVILSLRYKPEPQLTDTRVVSEVIMQLAERLGWIVQETDKPDQSRVITLNMTPHTPTILVIEDNEGLVKLLDDYLTGHACQVKAAASGQEGLQLTQQLMPDAVVLDVMLPEMDGWEVLQRLRHSPRTANIPVIICSVLDSPELAYSLGASLFLPKPVSRDDVLTALHRLGVV